jgi:hypothetical protein
MELLMHVLDIIEDINLVRKKAIKFAEGEISQNELRESIRDLQRNLSKINNQEILIKETPKKEIQTLSEKEETEKVISLSDVFYFNESNRLLYKLEVDKKGIAFSESHGYVIFVPNEQLITLRPALSFIDNEKLFWEIKETNDTSVVKAVNEIGDEVVGFKEVQELIDGQSTMEVE